MRAAEDPVEKKLVRHARWGSRRAFLALISSYQGELSAVARILCPDGVLTIDPLMVGLGQLFMMMRRWTGRHIFRIELLKQWIALLTPELSRGDPCAWRAIDRIDFDYRVAAVLSELPGLEYRELAVILGTSEGSAQSRVHEARLLLASATEQHR